MPMLVPDGRTAAARDLATTYQAAQRHKVAVDWKSLADGARDAWDQAPAEVQRGLIGAGVGGVGGGLLGLSNRKRKSPLETALTGALLGGTLGAASNLPSRLAAVGAGGLVTPYSDRDIANRLDAVNKQHPLTRAWNALTGKVVDGQTPTATAEDVAKLEASSDPEIQAIVKKTKEQSLSGDIIAGAKETINPTGADGKTRFGRAWDDAVQGTTDAGVGAAGSALDYAAGHPVGMAGAIAGAGAWKSHQTLSDQNTAIRNYLAAPEGAAHLDKIRDSTRYTAPGVVVPKFNEAAYDKLVAAQRKADADVAASQLKAQQAGDRLTQASSIGPPQLNAVHEDASAQANLAAARLRATQAASDVAHHAKPANPGQNAHDIIGEAQRLQEKATFLNKPLQHNQVLAKELANRGGDIRGLYGSMHGMSVANGRITSPRQKLDPNVIRELDAFTTAARKGYMPKRTFKGQAGRGLLAGAIGYGLGEAADYGTRALGGAAVDVGRNAWAHPWETTKALLHQTPVVSAYDRSFAGSPPVATGAAEVPPVAPTTATPPVATGAAEVPPVAPTTVTPPVATGATTEAPSGPPIPAPPALSGSPATRSAPPPVSSDYSYYR